MIITKHGVMRFKQRQKIKNTKEMRRKTRCAIERGKEIKNGTSSGISCYLFDGYYYIVAQSNKRLITTFRPRKPSWKGKKIMIEDIKIKEFKRSLIMQEAY